MLSCGPFIKSLHMDRAIHHSRQWLAAFRPHTALGGDRDVGLEVSVRPTSAGVRLGRSVVDMSLTWTVFLISFWIDFPHFSLLALVAKSEANLSGQVSNSLYH